MRGKEDNNSNSNDKRSKPATESKQTVVPIENFAFVTKQCKHQFHLECAKQIIHNQPSDQYFEFPECRTIQGVRIENQPNTGEMRITKENFELPGCEKSWSFNTYRRTICYNGQR